MDKPKLRDNLQVKQPHIAYEPEGNGWPEPLTDPSDPIRQKVTVGNNGETKNITPIATSQQKETGHHLDEGGQTPAVGKAQGLPTSQQKSGEYSLAEGN